MKIVKRNEYQMQYPMMESIEPGTAFEYDGKFYIKVNIDNKHRDFRWEALDLDNGVISAFKSEAMVRPLDAKVVIE